MADIYCAVDSCEFSDCGKCKKDSVQVNSNSRTPENNTCDSTACTSYAPKKC